MVNAKIRLIIFFAVKDGERSSIQSAKTRPGADCGSDHEFFIAKFRLKVKKVGKTTRPFRYDLNQIPNDYTVGVRNRFKGLDLIDRMSEVRLYTWNFLVHMLLKPNLKDFEHYLASM